MTSIISRYLFSFMIVLFLICYMSCSEVQFEPEPRAGNQSKSEEKIIIHDRTGKGWDISHAVRTYGFKPENFQFGLGPDAIMPINFPDYLQPEDPGFPIPSSSLVIGTKINDIPRAYPIFVLKSHEIVNESFGDTHVAVAY